MPGEEVIEGILAVVKAVAAVGGAVGTAAKVVGALTKPSEFGVNLEVKFDPDTSDHQLYVGDTGTAAIRVFPNFDVWGFGATITGHLVVWVQTSGGAYTLIDDNAAEEKEYKFTVTYEGHKPGDDFIKVFWYLAKWSSWWRSAHRIDNKNDPNTTKFKVLHPWVLRRTVNPQSHPHGDDVIADLICDCYSSKASTALSAQCYTEKGSLIALPSADLSHRPVSKEILEAHARTTPTTRVRRQSSATPSIRLLLPARSTNGPSQEKHYIRSRWPNPL